VDIDLELYRRDVRVSQQPQIYLSVIDIWPERPKKTIVFLHGYGGQALQWEYQLRAFSDSNRVIALDLRGHGHSGKPADHYAVQDLLKDIDNALDVLGVNEKVIMVGHSFGGALATEFCLENPQRVDRLVLIATAGEFKLNPLYRWLLRLPRTILRTLAPFVQNWLSAPPHVMHAWYHQSVASWNGWSLFRDLTLPTMVIRGHRDLVFENAQFEEVSRVIPTSEDINVGASGHMVMLERRDAVNRAIQRFIDPGKGTWRDDLSRAESLTRAPLAKERPWLSHYDNGVPYTISIPKVPLQQFLESSARRFPHRTAVIFEDKKISYQRLNEEVNRFAHALLSLGLDPGKRVMLLLPNLPQIVIGFFGTLKVGGVAVFTLPMTEPNELVRQVKDCGAHILITTQQFESLARNVKEHPNIPLKHIIFTEESDYVPTSIRDTASLLSNRKVNKIENKPSEDGIFIFSRLLYTSTKTSPDIEVKPSDLAVIQYTGGTTAEPKGVMLTHQNLVANALQTRHWMPEAQEGQERFLCVIPLSHSYGLTTALNLPIALGATLILETRFNVQEILKSIKKYRPTIFPGVPRMYVAIKDVPGVRNFRIDSIKACISGSAPLPMEVQEAFERLTRGRLVEGYGLTEASPVTHANPLHGMRKVGSIGIPLPSTEAKIVELRNRIKKAPQGQIGELSVRGPQVMLGYWNNSMETNRVMSQDGWLLTGDVAQMDNEGYFRIIARKADMWYAGRPDKPAFPRDVEEILFEIPQVKEAAVTAIAGHPIAFIITGKETPTSGELIAYCKRRLPPELVPRMVIFVDEFPRTFIGKVIRRELAKWFEENRQIND
jgi:long-chain acyl-CoA synthetase